MGLQECVFARTCNKYLSNKPPDMPVHNITHRCNDYICTYLHIYTELPRINGCHKRSENGFDSPLPTSDCEPSTTHRGVNHSPRPKEKLNKTDQQEIQREIQQHGEDMQQKHHLVETEQPQSQSPSHQEVSSRCADELTKERGLLMFERQQQRTLELIQDTERYHAQTVQVMEEVAIAERNKRMPSEERTIISETLREVCTHNKMVEVALYNFQMNLSSF